MAASEANTVQASKGTQSGATIPTIFTGVVTNIKNENNQQTLEVQYSQGKVKFQADGNFKEGEKVRLSFPGGNAVEVAKSEMPQPDKSNSGFTLPEALNSLDRNLLMQLTEALDQSPDNLGLKTQLQDLLHAQTSNNSSGSSVNAQSQLNNNSQSIKPNIDSFWSAEAGEGAAPWFGMIVDKNKVNSTINSGVENNSVKDSLFKYLVDTGASQIEVFSPQEKKPGDLAEFTATARPGKMGGMQAQFMSPMDSLTPELAATFEKAEPVMQKSLQLSARYLQDFKSESYFGKLVKDFSEVLAQSGRVPMEKESTTINGVGENLSNLNQSKPLSLPSQKELDGMLKLFLTFPRDSVQPEKQAKIWGDAVQNPKAMMDFLKSVKLSQDGSLLREQSAIQSAIQSPKNLPPSGVFTTLAHVVENRTAEGLANSISMPAIIENGEEASPEAIAKWLKKLLPDSFKAADLLKLAQDPNSAASAIQKDHDPAKFLLQAVANAFPKEDQMQQGSPSQFYFYQNQDWRGLQVSWKREKAESGNGRKKPTEPLKISVNTQAKLMGKVNVDVTLDPKGATINFKNQFHNVRDLLSQYLPELEKGLEYIDFKVKAWTYDMLPVTPEDLHSTSPGAWTRLALPSDRSKLDLLG